MRNGTQPGPIAASTELLLGWLRRVGLDARYGPPSDDAVDPRDIAESLTVWPLELLPEQQVRPGIGSEPLRFRIRYLVTGALDAMLTAAVQDGPYEPVFEPVPAQLWLALGARPRPSVLIDVRVRLERPVPRRPLVRQPLQVHDVAMRTLVGRVVGPGDVPLTDIRVQSADGTTSTYTDHTGAFTLAGLPADRAAKLLLAGRGFQFHTEVPVGARAPAVIRCDLEEV